MIKNRRSTHLYDGVAPAKSLMRPQEALLRARGCVEVGSTAHPCCDPMESLQQKSDKVSITYQPMMLMHCCTRWEAATLLCQR